MNNVAPKATIMAVVDSINAQRPIISRLGKMTRKSLSSKLPVRIDKNISNAVLDANSEIESDTAKIVKAISFVNTGMPVS